MSVSDKAQSLFAAETQSSPRAESSASMLSEFMRLTWESPTALILLGVLLVLTGFYFRHLVIKRIVKRRNPMGIEQYDSYASLAWNRRLNQVLFRISMPVVAAGVFLMCLGVFPPAKDIVRSVVAVFVR